MGKRLIIKGADFHDNAAQTGVWTVTWYNNDLENFTPASGSNASYAGFVPGNYSLFQNKTINMVKLQIRTPGTISIMVANSLERGGSFTQRKVLDFTTATANTIVEKQFDPIEVGDGYIMLHITSDTGKFGYATSGSNPPGYYTYIARANNNPVFASNNTLCVDFGYGRYVND